MIQRLLNKRFGRISPVLEQRLRDSKQESLDRFGESLFDFQDLKDAERWWETHSDGGNA